MTEIKNSGFLALRKTARSGSTLSKNEFELISQDRLRRWIQSQMVMAKSYFKVSRLARIFGAIFPANTWRHWRELINGMNGMAFVPCAAERGGVGRGKMQQQQRGFKKVAFGFRALW